MDGAAGLHTTTRSRTTPGINPSSGSMKTHPRPARNRSKRQQGIPADCEVIVLSSDTEDDTPVPRVANGGAGSGKAPVAKKKARSNTTSSSGECRSCAKRRKISSTTKDPARGKENLGTVSTKEKGKSKAGSGEVEDGMESTPATPMPRGTTPLVLQLPRVVDDDRDKKEIERLRNEVGTLKNSLSKANNEIKKLEDGVSCDICSLSMWTPYLLIPCGHVYCHRCIQDWFNTALAQHMQRNPNYITPSARNQYLRTTLANYGHLHPAQQAQVRAATLERFKQYGEPEYTCPTCRILVTTRPIGVYKIKELTKGIVEAVERDSAIKQVGETVDQNVFDSFFSSL